MDERDQIGFLILVALVITLILLIRKYLQYKKKQFKQEIQGRGHRTCVVLAVLLVIGACIKIMFKHKKKKTTDPNSNQGPVSTPSHHQDDVYHISGRIQGEHENTNRDAYLSIEHINLANQLNKPNCDDSPPSYEEAMRIVAAQSSTSTSEVPVVVVVPKTTTN